MQQNINVELTIVRNSNDEVSFEIVDRSSHVQFFSTKLSLEQFARLVTGMTQHDVPATVLSLMAQKNFWDLVKKLPK
jgi:hypothetical protein